MRVTAAVAALGFASIGWGQYQPIEGVEWREAVIWSEGVRLHAEVFSPRGGEAKLPTILMAHGWGGTARSLRPDAEVFAKAGYLAVTFDYRGWGESDPRVVLAEPAPEERPGGRFTAEVIEIREVVDPVEQTRDWLNALHWVHGESRCDASRIGLWGSSYSGGHVLWVAAHDKRVKAIFSQVGGMDSRFVVATPQAEQRTLSDATRRARGMLPYPKPSAQEVGNLRGAPIRDKLMHFAPVELAKQASHAAMMFVIAENEELFDNKDHAIKAHAAATGKKKLATVPGITHYGIYREAREQAQQMAVEWFDEVLKQRTRLGGIGGATASGPVRGRR